MHSIANWKYVVTILRRKLVIHARQVPAEVIREVSGGHPIRKDVEGRERSLRVVRCSRGDLGVSTSGTSA